MTCTFISVIFCLAASTVDYLFLPLDNIAACVAQKAPKKARVPFQEIVNTPFMQVSLACNHPKPKTTSSVPTGYPNGNLHHQSQSIFHFLQNVPPRDHLQHSKPLGSSSSSA